MREWTVAERVEGERGLRFLQEGMNMNSGEGDGRFEGEGESD